jgi:hypothetical protein
MTTKTDRTKRHGRTRLAFHASRIIIDIGVLLTMGAMSLPFVTSEMGNRNSIDADALPAILLLLPIFVITMIPDQSRPVPTPLGWLSLIFGIAAFPYTIVKFIDAATLADTLGGEVGLGARLLVFGTFTTLIGIGVGLGRSLLRLPQGGTYPAKPEPRSGTPASAAPTRRPKTAAAESAARRTPEQRPGREGPRRSE